MKGESKLKNIEVKLVAELMKNSRRSDRELARIIGVSQPTVSRMIKKLEQKGIIKEYTVIPDFHKLGYEIMGITSIRITDVPSKEEFEKIRKTTTELEKGAPDAALIAVNTEGGNKNRLFITFYKDYANYSQAMKLTKKLPFADVNSLDSYLVSLEDETNYRILSMSAIAQHLMKQSKEKIDNQNKP
jgi:DNA-binding Lrp family transcriptional regulator